MNCSVKFRFHMGCGEPLQCRQMVTRPVRAQLALQQEDRERNRCRLPAAPRGSKCK